MATKFNIKALEHPTGMIIDGISCSSAVDSSAEELDVEGCDISSFEAGDGIIDYEHLTPEETQKGKKDGEPRAVGSEVVGKIIYAYKILKQSDCETDRQRAYWRQVNLPFIYIVARLFDGAGHEGAKNLAAIMRDCVANGEAIILRWSIEGSTLERKGNKLMRTVARAVALTRRPCNKSAKSGILADPNAPKGFNNNPDPDDPLAHLIETTKHEHPMYQRLASIELEGNPIIADTPDQTKELFKSMFQLRVVELLLRKATIAGSGDVAPSKMTGPSKYSVDRVTTNGYKIKNLMMAALRDYPEDGPLDHKKFAEFVRKAYLPEASDDFMSHFCQVAQDFQGAKLKKARKPKEAQASLAGMSLSNDEPPAQAPVETQGGGILYNAFGEPAVPKPVRVKKEKEPKPEKQATDELNENVEPEDDGTALTIRGHVIPRNDGFKGYHFDEENGILHTPRGSFPMYIPGDQPLQLPDGTTTTHKDAFLKIMDDPDITTHHTHAMKNWTRLNKLAQAGKLPPEVVMHAVLFSQMSPNTEVPMQELLYSKLVDAMKQAGVDARSPKFKDKVKDIWMGMNDPKKLPEHAREYFEYLNEAIRIGKLTGETDLATGLPTWKGTPAFAMEKDPNDPTGKKRIKKLDENGKPIILRNPGDIKGYMLANNKFATSAKYHELHTALEDLLKRHKGDGRSAVKELMEHKAAAHLHDERRKKNPDIGPYTAGPAVAGLAPKTARYTLAMLGMGDLFVPDTHMARFLFALDKTHDSKSIAYLKQVLWNTKNSHVLEGVDRAFEKKHPSMDHVMNHPDYGHIFGDKHNAVFGAFWKTWTAITKMEKLLGFGGGSESNVRVSHAPYWLATDPYVDDALEKLTVKPKRKAKLGKSEEEDVPLAQKTAAIHASWVREYGYMPAMYLYARYLLPALLGDEEKAKDVEEGFPGQNISSPEHLARSAECQLVELRKAMAQINRLNSGVVDFGGEKVMPGKAITHEGHEYDLLHDHPEHWLAVPAGMNNPSLVVRLPKNKQNTHFRVISQPQCMHQADRVVPDIHGDPQFNTHPEQNRLISGMKMNQEGERNRKVGGQSLPSGRGYWVTGGNGKLAYRKEYYSEEPLKAAAEATFYNVARDFFGLGAHVPTTAIYGDRANKRIYSVMEGIQNPQHIAGKYQVTPNQKKILTQLGEDGTIDKLDIMDHIMGATGDRWHANWVFSAKQAPHLFLIDNAELWNNSFDARKPHYKELFNDISPSTALGQKHGIHENTIDWLMSLNPEGLRGQLAKHGTRDYHSQDNADKAVERLKALQQMYGEARAKAQEVK